MAKYKGSKPFQFELFAPKSYRPRFVLHRHKGPHWHYDLRFQLGKELIDFALSGCPSSDPKIFVQATRIHDHKIRALDLEGIIKNKDGTKGAMTISDQGSVQPYGRENSTPDNRSWEGLTQGSLLLKFEGSFMKGDWLLEGQGFEWTLRKIEDAYANSFSEQDMLCSVVSGKTVEELLQEC